MVMIPRTCILCNQSESVYLFSRGDARVVKCSGCDLLRREPAASFTTNGGGIVESNVRTEELSAQHYLRCLRDLGPEKAKILYWGLTEPDIFSQMLERSGHSVTRFEQESVTQPDQASVTQADQAAENKPDQASNILADQQSMSGANSNDGEFDCIILYQTLERAVDPHQLLSNLRRRLKKHGRLMIISVSLDSSSARVFGRRWIAWNTGLNHFFSRATLQLLLEKAGFNQIIQLPDNRSYTLEYASKQVSRLPDATQRKILQPLLALVPKSLKQKEMIIGITSSTIVMAHKTEISVRKKLSIIMPVYNEKRTFLESFAQINKRVSEGIQGIDDAEIIIVESNSTDGSRELVQSVQSDTVRVVLEERPQGKGHAVRTGLEHASGDFCIIQDADLEYDVCDYDALLQPLVEWRRTFVLGTRHSGNWKIRKFAGEAFMALVCNSGHILFTTIINVFYGQNLTDPFTMYKVFRRECLYKLKFECNRFDFDHELLIKLIQKGNNPLEIPVNYNARGFAEGKKIAVIRDPITWLIADVKYLFASPFVDDYKSIGLSSPIEDVANPIDGRA
jgi:hypothetical protein